MMVHNAIARALADHGVETMFGLIGDANMFLVHSFVNDEKRRYVGAVHEAGAMFMAAGYAEATGGLAVVTVTQGPALTNIVTGLVEAVRGRIPMLIIAGDTPAGSRNHPQDVDHRDFVVPTGAGFEQARSAATVLADLVIAARRARLEHRPVVFNVPSQFQWVDVEYQDHSFRLPEPPMVVPALASLDRAMAVLAAASRPVLLAGKGAIAAGPLLNRLAARIGAPVATTLKARDLFRGDPFDLGIAGSLAGRVEAETMAEADCFLVFGAGLNMFTTGRGELLRGKSVVQVDTDIAQLGPYDAVVAGDTELTALAIGNRLDADGIPAAGFRSAELAGRLRAANQPAPARPTPAGGRTVDFGSALRHLDRVLPQNRLLVTDGGRFMMESLRLVRAQDPRSFIYPGNFGSIGTGMGAAIGAAVADPTRATVLVCGDGGFLHGGLAEFTTAVREDLDLIVVVCNDGGYGAEHIQLMDAELDPAISLFAWPDLAVTAEALGGRGFTVQDSADLSKVAAAIEDRDRPLLIDLRLDVAQIAPMPH